jgi:hypothetical protein
MEAMVNYTGVSPNTADLLQQQWIEFALAHADDPSAKLLQFCHSQGAIHVRNALANAPQAIRDRLIVVAIAPAAIVPDGLCFESHNYATENDIVPQARLMLLMMLDGPGEEMSEGVKFALEEQQELIIVRQSPEDLGMGHSFQGKTFNEIIQKHIEDHIECKGKHNQKRK